MGCYDIITGSSISVKFGVFGKYSIARWGLYEEMRRMSMMCTVRVTGVKACRCRRVGQYELLCNGNYLKPREQSQQKACDVAG